MMKMIMIAFAGSAFALSAHAVTGTTIHAGTSASPQVSEESAGQGNSATRSGDAVSAASVSPTESVNASAGSIQTAVDTPKKPQTFGASLLSFTDTGVSSLYSGASSTNYTRLTLKYNLTESSALSARQEVISGYDWASRNGRSSVSDLRVGYTEASLYKINSDWTVSGAALYYLPVGEKARFENKRKGIFLPLVAVGRSYGKTDVEYAVAPYFFVNSQDSYLSEGKFKANPAFELDQYASATYNVSDLFSVTYWLGTYNVWLRPLPGAGNTLSQNLYHEIAVTVKPSKQVSLTASVDNEPNILDSAKPFQLFRDEDTVYRALVSVSL